MNRKDIRDKVIKIIEEEIYKVSKHTVSMGVEIRLFDRDSIKDFNKFVGYLDSRASRAMEPHFDDDSAISISRIGYITFLFFSLILFRKNPPPKIHTRCSPNDKTRAFFIGVIMVGLKVTPKKYGIVLT